ncbi:MAG: GNAT family N-acetyltransferase [Pseudomonadota bacterium]
MPDFSDRSPSVAEFRALRVAAGLSDFSDQAAKTGLAATLYGVWLRDGDRLVGMGRIVGDGGCFALVTDVAVHPEHQGRGLGRQIVARLMEWAEAELPKSCILSLIADPPADKLYQQFGFDYRVGMGRTLG